MTREGTSPMFGRLQPTRKTGEEPFTAGESALGFSVRDFWQWSSSNLVGNALRGLVAEFLVARAVGADAEVRNVWDPFDVVTPSGLRIEVESAAYLQSWAQHRESSMSFDIRETLAWNAETDGFAPEGERKRRADIYVFALLAHPDKATLNPLDVSQWTFYVLLASMLNRHLARQRRISFRRLQGLNPACCAFADLGRHIVDAGACRAAPQL